MVWRRLAFLQLRGRNLLPRDCGRAVGSAFVSPNMKKPGSGLIGETRVWDRLGAAQLLRYRGAGMQPVGILRLNRIQLSGNGKCAVLAEGILTNVRDLRSIFD